MDNRVVLEILTHCLVLIHFRAFWRQNYADLRKPKMEQWWLLECGLLKLRVDLVVIVCYKSSFLENSSISGLSLA